jgi:hypothetical protein
MSLTAFNELLEASSLGSPAAKWIREHGWKPEADLTGMPDEQADWDADEPNGRAATEAEWTAMDAEAVWTDEP